MWQDSLTKKEEALRSCYVKSLESLSEHTKPFPPLNYNDHVLTQNQAGSFPNKWGKSGVVLEVKRFHQTVVNVDGSGRLNLRNRKLLRRFNPPGCKTLGSVTCLERTNIPVQKPVFTDHKKQENFQDTDAAPCFQQVLKR